MPVHRHQTFDPTGTILAETVEVVTGLRVLDPPADPDGHYVITADGIGTAVVEWTDPDETGTVTFVVDGDPVDVAIDGHLAALEIVATSAGSIDVEAAGQTVTITAI